MHVSSISAYLLVDQGYEVWLGQSNSSIAENVISYVDCELHYVDFNIEISITWVV